jgi:hypothetical protein
MVATAAPSMTSTPVSGARGALADRSAAQRAVALALPMIEAAIADPNVCGSGVFCIVVMDPTQSPFDCAFDQAILYEHALGNRTTWDVDYQELARAKARLSWSASSDSDHVQRALSHRLVSGDSLLSGGVCLAGIVVAASGAEAVYDEAFSCAIAANLRAIAKQRHARLVADRRLSVPPGE